MRPLLKSILVGTASGLLVAVIGVTFAARDGTGNYSLPAGNPVNTGATISSTWANSTLSDIATALTNSLAKDGQTIPTANLPMGTFKHTNVGNATARNQYATAGQLQDFSLQTLGSVSGTDTITGSLNPAISSYTAGMIVSFTPANTNTGATTLAVNGLTALDVQKFDGDALTAGDLVAGIPAVLVLDSGGDDWILLNPQTADIPAATILTRLLTVDGSSSGLDADLLDGQEGSYYLDASNLSTGTLDDARVAQSNVTQHVAAIISAGNIWTSANDGSGSGLDADLLDGNSSSAFATASHTHGTSDITSGTLADARVASSSVTQHMGDGYARNITGKAGVAKTLSSSDPTGGSDGDIWYQYEAE